MAQKDIDRLMDNIRIRCPGVTDAGIQLELFRATDEFLRATDVWKESIPFTVAAGVVNYSIVPTDFGLVHRLVSVRDNNSNMVDANMEEPGELVLRTAPAGTATYTAVISKTCVDPTTKAGNPEFPEWVLRRHAADIEDGVLMRLFTQLGKPWSNNDIGAIHAQRFAAAISAARVDLRHQDWVLNEARQDLPGAMDADLNRALFRAVSEFTGATDIWQETLTVNIVANTTSYALTPAQGGKIHRLIWAQNAAQVLQRADMQIPGTMIVRFTPSQSETWSVLVAKSVIDPLSYPSWITDKYGYVLLDGVRAYMYAQPTKPYANQTYAVLHARQFDAGIANAIAESRRHNIFGGQRWSFPRFAK